MWHKQQYDAMHDGYCALDNRRLKAGGDNKLQKTDYGWWDMKRYDAKGYLIGAIGAFVLSAIFLMQARPIFIKLFIPFPKIEETTVYEGTLHIGVAGIEQSLVNQPLIIIFLINKD